LSGDGKPDYLVTTSWRNHIIVANDRDKWTIGDTYDLPKAPFLRCHERVLSILFAAGEPEILMMSMVIGCNISGFKNNTFPEVTSKCFGSKGSHGHTANPVNGAVEHPSDAILIHLFR
jgi:hypothetical protein